MDQRAAPGILRGDELPGRPRDVVARSRRLAERPYELSCSPRELTTVPRQLAGQRDPVASRSSELSD